MFISRPICNLGCVVFGRTGSNKAIVMARRALARDERGYGSDHPITIYRMAVLAVQLREAGPYDEAIALFRKDVAYWSEAHGPEDVDTAAAESHLAHSLWMDNQHEEAVILKRHVVKVYTRAFGPDDQYVLTESSALAGSLTVLRRYKEVEELLDGLLPTLESVLGPGNQWLIKSTSYLAHAQANLKKFGPSIELERRAVEMNEAKHGHDHVDTQTARYNLAMYLHWAGQDSEARLLALAVLHTKMRLGVEDDVTGYARKLIADIEASTETG